MLMHMTLWPVFFRYFQQSFHPQGAIFLLGSTDDISSKHKEVASALKISAQLKEPAETSLKSRKTTKLTQGPRVLTVCS